MSYETDTVTRLETNLDDLSPELTGAVMARLLAAGALDVWFTPIQMKKNRPATMVSILCKAESKDALTHMLYIETTTIGVRVTKTDRECLERAIVSVATEFGQIDVKIAKLEGRMVNAMPEYDHVKRAAAEHGVPFREVRDATLAKLTRGETKAAKAE